MLYFHLTLQQDRQCGLVRVINCRVALFVCATLYFTGILIPQHRSPFSPARCRLSHLPMMFTLSPIHMIPTSREASRRPCVEAGGFSYLRNRGGGAASRRHKRRRKRNQNPRQTANLLRRPRRTHIHTYIHATTALREEAA